MGQACRIAEALRALQNAGHAKYIVWSFSFYCDCEVDEVLKDQAKNMETELKEWNDNIMKLRSRYHALNYFTTQQLRVIRQKLGQLENSNTPLPSDVLSMLKSISPKITEDDISKVLMEDTRSADFMAVKRLPSVLEDSLNVSITSETNEIDQGSQPHTEVNAEQVISQLVDQLNSVQRKEFDKLKRRKYNTAVAYLSIKHCTKDSGEALNSKEVTKWYNKNEEKYLDMDNDALLKELTAFKSKENSEAPKDDSLVLMKNEGDNKDGATASSLNDTEKKAPTACEMAVQKMKDRLVNKNNVAAGIALEAAKLHPKSYRKALEYAVKQENLTDYDDPLVSSIFTQSPLIFKARQM